MVDPMCGPNMPLAKAFLFCGWRVLPIDWSLDPGHDLSNPLRQQALEAPLRSAAFTAAALDCSTKSRAREIPRTFADGRPGPKPLRSEAHPEGLPGLDPKNQRRVDVDNAACAWILGQLQAIADDGRGALRENPARSLHWSLPQEETMMESGLWYDTTYSACVFMSARCKHQRLRHNIREIELIHPRECHHQHAAWEWDPWEDTQGRHSTQPPWPSRLPYRLVGGRSAKGMPDSTCHGCRRWKRVAGGNIGWISTPELCAAGQ